MVDEDVATQWIHRDEEVDHMEAPTTTTPNSHERENKCNDMGVDDAMISLVDMMDCDCLHAMDDTLDVTYESFIFPCDDLTLHNVDHVELYKCDDIAIDMSCYEAFIFPTIACNDTHHMVDKNDCCVATNLMINFSFPMFVDNHASTMNMLCHKCLNYSPIVASKMLNNFSFLMLGLQ